MSSLTGAIDRVLAKMRADGTYDQMMRDLLLGQPLSPELEAMLRESPRVVAAAWDRALAELPQNKT